MNIFSSNIVTKLVNNNNVKKFATQMCNTEKLLPVILLESTVISGRSYQAYKRGGKTELRERLIDETLTAVVWFGIVEWMNKLFNKVIKTPGIFSKDGIKEIEYDLGKDAIRNPIENAIQKNPKIKNIIGGMKITKIALSAFVAVYLSGYILPKFYQNITKNILKKEKNEKLNNNTSPKNNISSMTNINKVSMDDFLKKTSQNKQLSFNGGNFSNNVNCFANILENHPIAKLLTVDSGLFIGRMKNARNVDESVEFGFRDISSSFFYLASTPLVYKFLSKYIDKYKGKNTNLDPITAEFITKEIQNSLPQNAPIEEASKILFGTKQELAKNVANDIKAETLDIAELKEILNKHISDNAYVEKVMKKAQEFIDLRPEGASRNLLTKSEIINSVNDGILNAPKLLTDAVSTATEKLSQDPEKFISFKNIDKIKKNIFDYAQSILDYAKAKGDINITSDLLTSMKNRNLIMKAGYTIGGLAVSALFLSTIIPRLQCKITEWRTGKKDFPGIRDLK